MREYRIGDPALDQRLAELIHDAVDGQADDDRDERLVAEMLVSGLKMLRDDTDRGDLKLVNSALKEMRYSFLLFSRYKHIPKVTIYGSARTPSHDPNYALASEFANRMADVHQWMIITGAGPGIMEAGNLGAGREKTFGVNIRLPFEAEANEHVDSSRLINFKYFFTRKLMFVKESDAFALFPGGFGTQDETFELLTLIQTGKSDMHPVVLLEAPGTGYWDAWLELVATLEKQGMISPNDSSLFLHTHDIDEACDEILRFYRTYHSQRYVDGKLVLRLKHAPSAEVMAAINEDFTDLLSSGTFEVIEATDAERADDDVVELPRIRFNFNRRLHGRLRQLIDVLNRQVGDE